MTLADCLARLLLKSFRDREAVDEFQNGGLAFLFTRMVNKKVLIFCKKGANRSALITALFLFGVTGKPLTLIESYLQAPRT